MHGDWLHWLPRISVWAHDPSTTKTPSKKILWDEMGWMSTVVRVGSLGFSTPSYLPITTFPFPPVFMSDCIFLTTVGTIEEELLQSCRALQVYLFQASSKFQAMCMVFHLFSFESLASFKNKSVQKKVKKRTDIFFFFFTSSLVKKICNTLRPRFLLLTEKRGIIVKITKPIWMAILNFRPQKL